MKFLPKAFLRLNIYLQIIFILCVIGVFYNVYCLVKYREFAFYVRAFLGFGFLYLMQCVLIYARDARAVMFSALQCFFALFASGEFTFYLPLQPFYSAVKMSLWVWGVNYVADAAYIMFALLLTLELLKTKLLYDFLKHDKNN